MPLFDFKCPSCGMVREVLLQAHSAVPVLCNHDTVHFVMEKQPSAPSFQIRGFSHQNGYASPRTFTHTKNGIKTTTTGNVEAFSDGLHN